MRITATIDKGAFSEALKSMGPVTLDAANRATERQTKETELMMRDEITRGLSARAANAYRHKWKFNSGAVGVQVVGFTYSAWRRKPRGGGQDVDMLQVYETGAIIRPVRGKSMAAPLPSAYAIMGMPQGTRGKGTKNRPDVRTVESVLGVKLFKIAKPGRTPILATDTASITGGVKKTGRDKGKVVFKIRALRHVNKRGGVSRRRATKAVIPLFALLKNVRLLKRLNFSRIEEDGAQGLQNKLDIEMAARGVFT